MTEQAEKIKLTCGLVMPISQIDGLPVEHWLEVKQIIIDAIDSIEEYDFKISLVSDSDEVGIIQKRIVQNLYSSDVVVVDVSCKNANVMFELGMRLAFDRPTVIVKDDLTNYSFDTSPIEHLNYPRDLRFSKIVDFKNQLAKKVVASYKKQSEDPEHSTFLKSFGEFKVASLNETKVTPDNLMLDLLYELKSDVSSLKQSQNKTKTYSTKINSILLNNESILPENEFIQDAALVTGRYMAINDLENAKELLDDEDYYKYAIPEMRKLKYNYSEAKIKLFLKELLKGVKGSI